MCPTAPSAIGLPLCSATCGPGGSLVFTTHGHVSLDRSWENSVDLGPDGIWFVPASQQHDIGKAEYGTAITSTAYVTRQIFRRLAAPLALLSQGLRLDRQPGPF